MNNEKRIVKSFEDEKNCPFCGGSYPANIAKCPNCLAVLSEEKIEKDNLKKKQQRKEEEAEIEQELIRRKTMTVLKLVGIVVVVLSVIKIVKFQTSLPLSNGMTKDQVESYYESGLTYLENQQYAEAVKAFGNVPEDSKHYKEAAKLYKDAEGLYLEEITRKAREYSESGDNETAIKLVGSAIEVIPENVALSSEKSRLMATRERELVKTAKENAIELRNAGDYPNAIKCLMNTLKQCADDELKALLESYSSEYESTVLYNSESLYEESGYDAVIQSLATATKVLPDSKALNEEYVIWKERKPVLLSDMEEFSCRQANGGEHGKDNYGNTYSSKISQVFNGTGHIEYYLGGKYRRFTSILYVCASARGKDLRGVSVSIYGDDSLLASFTEIDSKNKPIEVNVDISEVEFLRIEFNYACRNLELGEPTVGW